MKRIEDYLERGLSADEIGDEFAEFCDKAVDCESCKYNGTACRYAFLLDEMPHDKTLLELFFEQNPNAPKTSVGTPKPCPYMLGYEERLDHNDKQDYDCVKCWNRKCKDVIEGYEE